MTHVLTFVASDTARPLLKRHLQEAEKIMGFYNITPAGPNPGWLAKDKAADLFIPAEAPGALMAHLREMLQPDAIDIFITPDDNRRKKLLIADMDATIVRGETLDDLAEFAGLKDQIAAITALAMEGKLDFKEALRERVALLRGLTITAIMETLDKLTLNPGAKEFVQTMKHHGTTCVLVSGGFTIFTEAAADRAGFDHHHGNTLEIENNALNGKVTDPILDKHAKVDFLEHYLKQLDLTPADALAIGDGANDIPMLKKAGLGIGYQPKHAVAEAIPNLIIHGDLTAALYAQGYSEKEIH
jgi:phosphoserine phosphatase